MHLLTTINCFIGDYDDGDNDDLGSSDEVLNLLAPKASEAS